ncbi:hypothetical protein WR25_02021 [Diploscapter pachys]|uniref:Uncharacterized protein n=1 Tax=Diploscapter pachys TaxID=2018661 RepID=A0A2A2K9J1_9BILA|nr:hypothetical protein WR25_02021 [Diploscapter pachys]
MPEQSTSSTLIHWSATEDGRVMRSIATQTDPPPLSMDDFILAEHCARIAEMNGLVQDGDELVKKFGAMSIVDKEKQKQAQEQTTTSTSNSANTATTANVSEPSKSTDAISFSLPGSFPLPVPEHEKDYNWISQPPLIAQHFAEREYMGIQTEEVRICLSQPAASQSQSVPIIPVLPSPFSESPISVNFSIPPPPLPPAPLVCPSFIPPAAQFPIPPIPPMPLPFSAAATPMFTPQMEPPQLQIETASFFLPTCPPPSFMKIVPAPPPVAPGKWHPKPVPAFVKHVASPQSQSPAPGFDSPSDPVPSSSSLATYIPGPPPPQLLSSYLERNIVKHLSEQTPAGSKPFFLRPKSLSKWLDELSSSESEGLSSEGVYSDDDEETLKQRQAARELRRDKRRRRMQRMKENRSKEAVSIAKKVVDFANANELAKNFTPPEMHIKEPKEDFKD